MLRRIILLVLPVLALIAGAFAGEALRPPPEPTTVDQPDDDPGSTPTELPVNENPAWMSFANQFFVPVMRNGNMRALMILTLSLETSNDGLTTLQSQEHRLRDAILRQLLIESNTGAFDGNYTAEPNLRRLREALLQVAQAAGGDLVHAVLIQDIARQEH
ncbi:hypothetical protein SAMN04489859_101412 [Paracoccus alcaliphilus]|uniref:Flagellar protein FliL n=1 Tax=Paracoccus alcaliphilus TaxID=34002 RepID=A0A1H8IRF8_9RHOB|nr:hypothetical protein [Paracoccus alcaliphilus]WCR18263.1 hypothetical protein JHW40_00345 [Paracoccus alcaliphilus]SEN71500.1 hypothetical protein SAMN04489859_101412 [Paracoccus alcaliphilus]